VIPVLIPFILNLQKASDYDIFLRAYEEKRIIISLDTDFGFILSQWKKNLPSVILLDFFPPIQISRFSA
jgi:predicted nuclease of predicted toxin-antitoxin system